jgi:O-acetyl-ADP-ribose deacetylase (regulator of RNase III)
VPEVAPGVRCPTGEARITPGFDLPARFVIHTVGPIYTDGRRGEPELLARCYRSSLRLAREHGLRSIAFPAISCGVYGYPLRAAAAVARQTLVAAALEAPPPLQVVLVAFGDEMLEVLTAACAS